MISAKANEVPGSTLRLLMTHSQGASESASLPGVRVYARRHRGAEQSEACGSAALHPGILVVVAVVRAPVTLVAVPQGQLWPLTGNIVQPDGPRA